MFQLSNQNKQVEYQQWITKTITYGHETGSQVQYHLKNYLWQATTFSLCKKFEANLKSYYTTHDFNIYNRTGRQETWKDNHDNSTMVHG